MAVQPLQQRFDVGNEGFGVVYVGVNPANGSSKRGLVFGGVRREWSRNVPRLICHRATAWDQGDGHSGSPESIVRGAQVDPIAGDQNGIVLRGNGSTFPDYVSFLTTFWGSLIVWSVCCWGS